MGKRTTDKHSSFDICDPAFLDNLSENLFFFRWLITLLKREKNDHDLSVSEYRGETQ